MLNVVKTEFGYMFDYFNTQLGQYSILSTLPQKIHEKHTQTFIRHGMDLASTKRDSYFDCFWKVAKIIFYLVPNCKHLLLEFLFDE